MPPKKSTGAAATTKRVTRGRKSASLQEVDYEDFGEEEEAVKEEVVKPKGRGRGSGRGKTRVSSRGRGKASKKDTSKDSFSSATDDASEAAVEDIGPAGDSPTKSLKRQPSRRSTRSSKRTKSNEQDEVDEDEGQFDDTTSCASSSIVEKPTDDQAMDVENDAEKDDEATDEDNTGAVEMKEAVDKEAQPDKKDDDQDKLKEEKQKKLEMAKEEEKKVEKLKQQENERKRIEEEEKIAEEQKRVEMEKEKENERKKIEEQEKKKDQERLENERRLEQERLEKEKKLEQERLDKEKAKIEEEARIEKQKEQERANKEMQEKADKLKQQEEEATKLEELKVKQAELERLKEEEKQRIELEEKKKREEDIKNHQIAKEQKEKACQEEKERKEEEERIEKEENERKKEEERIEKEENERKSKIVETAVEQDLKKENIQVEKNGAEKEIVAHANSGDQKIAEQNEMQKEAGSDFVFINKDSVPSSDSQEVADSLPANTEKTQDVTKNCQFSKNVKPPTPKDALYHRNLLVNRNQRFRRDDPDFSIATYNILHETHALNCVKEYGSYAWLTVDQLLMDVRHKALLTEIGHLNVDILCLQEVSPSYFEKLKGILEKNGYSGEFIKRDRKGCNEGEATFFKTKKFALMSCDRISITEQLNKELEAGKISSPSCKEAIKKSIDSHVVLLITRLQHNLTKQALNVGNIHVTFEKFSRPDLQCVQVACALRQLNLMTSTYDRMCIVGDFNSTPNSPVYQMIQDRKLNALSIAKLKALASVDVDGKMECLLDIWPAAFQHNCQLSSVYKVVDNQEPITSKFPHDNEVRKVDYIWFKDMIPRSILYTPPHYKIRQGIPSTIFPSDHVSLKAEFNFK